jgi:hypothetical protein
MRVWNGTAWQSASTVGGTVNSLTVNNSLTLSAGPLIVGEGPVVIGSAQSQAITGSSFTDLQVNGTDGKNGITIARWNAASPGPFFGFRKSRAATIGGSAIVANSDTLGELSFFGDDGTDTVIAATIRVLVDGTPGVGSMPGRLTFNTTPSGSSSTVERMRIDNAGNVGIGTSAPTALLNVNGAADVSQTLLNSASGTTGQVTKINATSLFSSASQFDYTGGTLELSAGAVNTNRGNDGRFYTGGDVRILSGNAQGGGASDTRTPGSIIFGLRSIDLTGAFTDTERMRITSAGNVGIGFDAMSASNTYGTPNLGVGRDDFGSFQIESHNNTVAINGSYLGLMRSRGSKASPTNCLSGDLIGQIGAEAFQTAGSFPYRTSARIQFFATANHSSTSLPTDIRFSTVPTGSTALNERMRIDSAGNVGIGTSSPLEQLHLLENYLARTAGRAGLVNRGVKYIVQSAGTSATNICRFNVGYENTAGRATAALIDITIMYATHDSNSRAAVSVANLRASVVRGDRAGNQFGTSTNLQLIGNAVLSDTGGSTFRLIDISNFSSSLTGGASAAQQVTIEFTPPSPLASGGSVVAIAEIVNLSSANGPLVTLVKL